MLSTRDRNLLKIKELLPERQYAVIAWCDECELQGFPIKISEVYRTRERQNDLYEQGRTRPPWKIVTYTRNSDHTKRLALDVYAASGESTPEFYSTIEMLAKKYGITHPFTGAPLVDLPHFSVSYVSPEKPKEPDKNSIERAIERLEKKGANRTRLGVLKRLLARIVG